MKLLAVSKLRGVNASYLRAMKETEFVVVTERGNNPVITHALIPYAQFLQLQELYRVEPERKENE